MKLLFSLLALAAIGASAPRVVAAQPAAAAKTIAAPAADAAAAMNDLDHARPLSLLILGPGPVIDARYAADLKAADIDYALVDYFTPLTPQFLHKFSVVVVDKLPFADADYQLFGQRMAVFHHNMQLLWQCAAAGQGVLVYTNLNDAGGWLAGGWNDEMKQWGIQLLQMCVRDPATAFDKFTVYGPNYYCWTTNYNVHPITAGLGRFYYPSVNGRWDDCYSAPPLLADKNWTPLVRGMPTATVITETDREDYEETAHKNDTTLAAVRPLGHGRLGVLSINPVYTHEVGYTVNGKNSECNWGEVGGVILSKGDGKVASDTGKFVMRLYRWLAQSASAAGFGGYKTGEPIALTPAPLNPDSVNFDPKYDPDHVKMPPSWRHRPELVKRGDDTYAVEVTDPMVTGPLQYFKALIGAHSAASDGRGSVADYVKACKKAGYAAVFFTENFEKLTEAKYARLVADCAKNTTADFFCLPGIDIQDRSGNHFILAGVTDYPRRQWLTADGHRLLMTAYINLTLHSHTVIAHRPLEGPLPYERLKHFQGVSVYTYRGGKLVEDASKVFAWEAITASNPNPTSVHEVFAPRDVSLAARTGYQQILPSDTIQHAVGYFRAGFNLYFDSPSRHMLSEGPIVYDFTAALKDVGPAAMNREQFRVAVGVRSAAGLRSVTLYDGYTPIRHWLPAGNDFHATVELQHAQQHALYVRTEDNEGKKALTACIRTVGHRYVFRCGDRQNWLGEAGYIYTGTYLPPRNNGLNIMMPVKGTAEASQLMPDVPGANMAVKLNFPFTCDDLVLTEATIEDKYIDALFDSGLYKIGFDATASQPSEPSTIYAAHMRYYNFTNGRAERPYLSLVEFQIKLKKDVEPVNPGGLFPALASISGHRYLWNEGGKLRSGDIGADTVLDIPVGGMAGGFVALTPGLQIRNGKFGFAPAAGNPAVLKAGTTFTARFLMPTGSNWQDSKTYSFDTDAEAWCKAMGLLGNTPYHLSLTRGQLQSTTFFANLTAQGGGVAGSVDGQAKVPFEVPLHIAALNENWPVGIWRENGKVTYSGVFEGTAWPLLDTTVGGRFYAGNLLTCDNPAVVLSVIKWSGDDIRIEAHNPTDKPIVAAIATAPEIAGYKALQRTLTIPAGTSLVVEDGAPAAG